ncbi:PepSY domain-containing protein [Oceanobacillus chungangensis]|uniref:PepSY domain-containing protein n=1 Tax=Oceanobacillus chungangensis TaxID=1229152 RepID=A0A3D8PNY2_9BACI|nr:PepSY domain-containing protein [Oceanobacillus chungangensis]RDW17684.1 hypothetical protein CWR45_10080 [Oceanobacillus chungangensis]
MKFKSKILIGTLIVIELLGTSACSMTNNKPNTPQTNETTQIIDEVRAVEIASDEVKGGIVISSHVDEVTNKYEVHILKGNKNYAVDVDSLTGKVLGIEQSVQSDDESKLQNVSPKISIKDARQIALNRASGTIIEFDLDNSNNSLVYDILISTDYSHEVNVIVDAINGEVLKVEKITY